VSRNITHSNDLIEGLLKSNIWLTLAWFEIKQRYKRSTLGPLWITLSTAIMIFAMGPLYSRLFGTELSDYFLHLALGVITWQFVSTSINDSCTGFTNAEGYIKDFNLPFSIYILRILCRNLIIFFHNFIVILILIYIFQPELKLSYLYLLPNLLLLSINLFWITALVGIVCTRYRDFTPIVNSLVGVSFFLTPIMWKPNMLGEKAKFMYLNPFYNYIELVRNSIIDINHHNIPLIFSLSTALLGILFINWFFNKYKQRIIYWI
jgi:lipopolysaccharide transport system permease protein